MQQNNSEQSADETNSFLQAVADCAAALLGDEDFERGVNRALEILGASASADRLCVNEHIADRANDNLGCVVVRYEWLSSYSNSQLYHPDMNSVSYAGIEDSYRIFASGQHWGGLINTMSEPFRSNQKEKLGVKATYAIPIMIEGKYWGIIGLDFCQTARELSDAEIAVLKTAASFIGSAIQRERSRCAKEEAERTALLEQQKVIELAKSERILNITANAAQALLNNENLEMAIANALQIIGEGIDTDRVVVMEHCQDSTEDSLGYAKVLFEWHSPHAVSQLHHPNLQRVSYEGIESWYERLSKGEAVGGVVNEFPEPLRSGQIEIGVKSMYSVPIMVNGKYWGIVGFDDCREAKQHSKTEISVLKTTAACIGSAIQQSRIRQRREQAERDIILEQQRVTQLQEQNFILEKRDRILAATALSANVLLTGEDFDCCVNRVLQIIGESIDTDRVVVIENWHNLSKPSIPHWRVIYEWDSPDTIPQISHPELTQGSWEGIQEWYELCCKGKSVSSRLEDMPEPFRSGQAKLGVKVLYVVPIFIEGKFWGNIGFDDCREETHRSEAELNILKTAAACIGGAIEQERIRRAKEQAERNILLEREKAAIDKAAQLEQSNQILSLRDRWLEATANAANQLLKITELNQAINAALKILGENLDCDRVMVMQNVIDCLDRPFGFLHVLYEWHSADTISQLLHPKLNKISGNGIEENNAKLQAGEWIGGLIEEFSEPFYSGQIELGVKSTYAVPIFVDNQFWGILAFDHCRESKRLTLAEIAVLKTAASCIGSAIYRQQIQQEKEQAELAILEERNRMAREIHDTLAQAFTGISLQLEAAKNILPKESEAVQERLLRAKNLAKEGITEARRSVRALRSEALEYSDLVTALRQLVDKMVLGTSVEAQVLVEGETRRLASEIEVELFRIAQEALTNSLNHARANKICIQLIYETNTIHLLVNDNGIGFNTQQLHNQGFGLIGMRERCDRLKGNLVINSKTQQGTEIVVTVITNSI
ncbi:MAG: GAF domain-containing protein [Rivularia sp. (in: Bacteria)]|nr:GAF domain-containing protein [Rivularia sp. MS3]